LEIVETAQVQELARLLHGLNESTEQGTSLLDHSMILYGSNLGSAARHDTTNLPILLAGGGFQHGRHLAFSRTTNRPLADLYVTMLQKLGVETNQFSSSSGNLSELESAA
jgi:hypothetical protein